MRKKTLANLIMILCIITIVILGILGVGYIKGWFDKSNTDSALLTDSRGVITLKRDGIAFTPSDNTILRSGDKITCDAGSTVKIDIGDGYITLGQSAEVKIINPRTLDFSLEMSIGEAFIDTVSVVSLKFDKKNIEIKDAVATLSVRKGVQSLSVYYGVVKDAKSGQLLEWIDNQIFVREFTINNLNDFNITQIRKANAHKELIFNNEALDELESMRWAQLHNSNEATQDTTTKPNTPTTQATENTESEASIQSEFNTSLEETTSTENTTTPQEASTSNKNTATTNNTPQITTKNNTIENTTTKNTTKQTTTQTTIKETTKPEETTEPPVTTVPEETKPTLTCTLTIRCDTILNNMQELESAKAIYVPESGCILPVINVEFTPGETVFDVLNRACKQYGIQIEYSWTPMYDSYYIEGINNLYEFDCGYESGWMYKVNGWFPNYGCSSYELTGGETIVWCYTCKGLGEDVGAERFN